MRAADLLQAFRAPALSAVCNLNIGRTALHPALLRHGLRGRAAQKITFTKK